MTTSTETSYEVLSLLEEIRVRLARRRMSASAAATQLGWSAFYMSRRMTGAVDFSIGDLIAIAGLLEMPPAELFEKAVRYRGLLLAA